MRNRPTTMTTATDEFSITALRQQCIKINFEFPTKNGWLTKQSPTGVKPWQKRWVVLTRSHLLWAAKEVYVEQLYFYTNKT